MRFKITIFLLLINAGLFYTIHHYESSNNDTIDSESSNIIGLTVEDIDKISIKSKLWETERLLERSGTEWELIKPIQWPANLFAVQRIITQLQFLKPEVSFTVEEIEDAGQSLSDYGLDNPNVELTFWGNGKEQSLKIGKATNLGNRVYALNPDQSRILVIKEGLLDSLSARLEDIRNAKIFSIPLFDLSQLSIDLLQPHNLKIRLSKDEGEWSFEAPIQASANNTLVNSAINQLSSLNIDAFVNTKSIKRSELGLDNPNMRVTLEGRHEKQTLLIGSIAGKNSKLDDLYYARLAGNPTIFTVTAAPFITLKDAQEALRDKQFIKINRQGIRDVEISQSDKHVKLQQLEDGLWQMVEKSKDGGLVILPGDINVIEKMVDRIEGMEAVAFISDAPSNSDLKNFGFNDPQRIIKLNGDESATLLIGDIDKETGNLYAKLEQSPFIYLIQPNVLSMVPVSPLFYQQRMLNQLPKGAIIKSIKLSKAKDGSTLIEKTLKNKDMQWADLLTGVEEKKKTSLLGMVQDLREFKVAEYIGRNFTSEVMLDAQTIIPWQYKLEIGVQLPSSDVDKDETYEYYFTRRLGGNLQIGGSPKEALMFSISQEWIDHLFAFHDDAEGYTQS